MPNTPLLAIPQLVENQTQAFTTANEALTILEQASNRRLAVATLNTNVLMTIEQMTRNVYFHYTGNTGAITVRFPAQTESPAVLTSPATQRLCIAGNGGSGTITVRTDDPTGSTISLIAGESAMIFINGKDVIKVFSSTGVVGGGGGVITLGAFVAGAMPPATEIMRYTVTETTTFSDNFADSRGSIGVNPTALLTFNVYRNVTLIGTITISTGGVFTFATSGSTTEVFAAGDYLSVVTGGADATAANISFTLKGTR